MAIVKLLCRHPGGTFTLQVDNSLSNQEFRNILSERTSIEPSYQNSMAYKIDFSFGYRLQ